MTKENAADVASIGGGRWVTGDAGGAALSVPIIHPQT